MAKVQFGSGVSEMRGSIGGVTFQRNQSGNIARSRGSRTRRINEKVSAAHQLINLFHSEWTQLNCEQKENWNQFADANERTDPYGFTRKLTGYQYFNSINYWRSKAGNGVINNPPSFELPSVTPNYNFIVTPTQLDIEFLEGFNQFTTMLVIEITMPLQVMPSIPFRFLRTIEWAIFDVIPPTYSLLSQYENYFGFSLEGFDQSTFNLMINVFAVHRTTGLVRPGIIKKHCG